jgi:tetratricopeptide (TPR) repeat protein
LQTLEWTLDALLLMWNGRFNPSTGIDVVLFKHPSEWEEFGELWVAGRMIPISPRPMIVIVGESVAGDFSPQQRIVAHELTHFLLRHIFVQTPLWFEEGFAQFTETVEKGVDDGTVVFGRPDENILRYLQVNAPLPLGKLWGWGAEPIPNGELPRYYASSFAWFHYLYNHQRDRFGRFWQGLAEGLDAEKVWRQAFDGIDEKAIYMEMKRYLDGGQYVEFGYPMAEKTIAMTENTLSPAEVHLLRAKLFAVGSKTMSQKEQTARIRTELLTAVAVNAGQVEARAELIQLDEDKERQWQSARKLQEEYPKNIAAQKAYIDALRKRGDIPQLKATLVRVLDSAPRDPSILGELALLRADAGEVEEADRLVARALDAAPWDPRVLATCAVVAALSGACDLAERFEHRALLALTDLTAFSESGPGRISREFQTLLAPAAAACKTK